MKGIMADDDDDDDGQCWPITLTEEHQEALRRQKSRPVSDFQLQKLSREAKKHWDLFYKRNEDRFFKDRHWTIREFEELSHLHQHQSGNAVLLEMGCGVGNFVFPLLEWDQRRTLFVYACDFSGQAVDIVKKHALYDEHRMLAFQADVTDWASISPTIRPDSVHIVSLVFVLSALKPDNFLTALSNIFRLLAPGGLLLFRDYGVADHAMFRFKQSTNVSDRHYIRQDGTLTYFFTTEEMQRLARSAGFEVEANEYVHKRTVNVKKNVDVGRIFIQGKFRKPRNDSPDPESSS